MTLLSVVKTTRAPYEDVYHAFDEHGTLVETHRELAPVEAFYDLTVESAGQRLTFGAEVRTGRAGTPQIDWDDELADLMLDQRMPPSAWDAVNQAVFAEHVGNPLRLPLELSTSPDLSS